MRIERRRERSIVAETVFRVLAASVALLLSGMVLEFSGFSVGRLLERAVLSTLGSSFGREQVLILATPLIITGLSVVLGVKMQIWNIGAEGQLFMGAWAAAAVGLHIEGPRAVVLCLMFVSAGAAGSAWILAPALLRAYLSVNEIITTLLLNFVAVLFVEHHVYGPWRDRTAGGGIMATERIRYEIPTLSGRLHIGILVAILLAIVVYLSFRRTRWGYEVKTIGGSQRTADFVGIPVRAHVLTIMLTSGFIAGIAGVIEITGTVHRLSGTISNEYGYLGIIAAAMSMGSPLVVVLSGLFLALLVNAGIVLQVQGVSLHTVLAVTGLILLFTGMGQVAAGYRLVRLGRE